MKIKIKNIHKFKKKKKNRKIFIKFCILLIIFSFIIIYYFIDIFFINFFDIRNIEKYLKICNSSKLINKKKFKKVDSPKISIISPVFNREEYIIRFLRSIQNQNFNDIEIIFIDDYSKDNSVKIIEEYQKKDERIKIIKNKKNKGTFKCRNEGALFSKGKYLILPDPDDILSKNILEICYNFLELYNYEMIRFNLYSGNGKIFFYNILNGLESKAIYQPQLSTYLFYGKGRLKQIDFNVSNKFIKREAYIRALNSLTNYYLNMYMTVFEDGIMNFILYRNAKSFYFLNKIGYYYIKNKKSITKKGFNYQKLKSIFLNLEIIFEYSKNTKYEKDMANAIFYRLFKKKFINKRKINLSKEKEKNFYNRIINMYLNNNFIFKTNKNLLKIFKLKFINI